MSNINQMGGSTTTTGGNVSMIMSGRGSVPLAGNVSMTGNNPVIGTSAMASGHMGPASAVSPHFIQVVKQEQEEGARQQVPHGGNIDEVVPRSGQWEYDAIELRIESLSK